MDEKNSSILFGSCIRLGLLGNLLVVVFNIEGAEHVCEKAGVKGEQSSNWFWEITAGLELNLKSVHEDDQELNLQEDRLNV